MLVSLLGYSLDSDDGDGLAVAFSEILAIHKRDGGAASLASLLKSVDTIVADTGGALSDLIAARTLAGAVRRLRRLDTPSRRPLFVDGAPLDVAALLESDRDPTKTRIAIVYLNSLDSQEDKELVVAALVDRVYRWMLTRPSSKPQLLFYIDEVAPYLPPVRKPACKEGLVLLLKQARKYGVGCLIASQNPGDVDYRALGQLGTWALGRLVTRQDLKKIEPSVSSLAAGHTDKILGALPRLKPGEFWLLSPDSFAEPVALEVGRLEAPHRTLDIGEVAELADARWRERFPPPPPELPVKESPRSSRAQAETEIKSEPQSDRESPPPALPDAPGVAERIASALVSSNGMRASALADAIGMSESATRRHLRLLVDQGRAGKVRRGREVHYLWVDGGGRADLELGASVISARRTLAPEDAKRIAEGYSRSRLFGILPSEDLAGVDRVDAALYAVHYREPLRPGTISRLLGERSSHLEGTVYLEPTSLELLSYSPSSGVRFREPSSRSPSDVDDLDGQVELISVPLATLSINEGRWLRRRPIREAVERFLELFAAEVIAIQPVFIPLWRVRYHQRRGAAVRVLLIDALRGHAVEWPES